MTNIENHKAELEENGFTTVASIFSDYEINQLIEAIHSITPSKPAFRKSQDLFSIRQFLKEIPEARNLIFNQNFIGLIRQMAGEGYFVVKSIYFDKPETSNWFVAYHQDLTISVDRKVEMDGFHHWTVKDNQFAVQPPLNILQNIFTFRIHLDDTDENNGALKVIPTSHKKGIYRANDIDWAKEKEAICNVPKAGVMVMKPLLLHGSNRTTNNQQRRVIHLEFANINLPEALQWAERKPINAHHT